MMKHLFVVLAFITTQAALGATIEVEMHERGELRRPNVVAREIWGLLDRKLENGAVVDLRDLED